MIEGEAERLVDAAWPAPHRVRAGEWVYRHAGGVTKRANSVLAVGEPPEGIAAAVDAAERHYASLGTPCVFSMGPGAPEGLDAELARRGYALADPTLIMTASLGTACDGAPEEEVGMAEEPFPAWLRAWWRVDGRYGDAGDAEGAALDTALGTASRILGGVPARYAWRGPREAPYGVGRGVAQGDWYGIYCMAVLPGARRAGHARSVLRALLSDAEQQGAKRAYLVVTEANTAARALYERAGFTESGRYHYRVG
ncbi:ribosomal protein S18 acetylase RimI-like enzyme [Thermocatellispora tengchongensis]|uniref:Ribosomal protein S18 acetylase RimI-like enzyme n=1 Tax=Thermocatellispora tengchongensis TaxID=1073253 RepID=A0A840P877_9ACTN|nr:GNAT family N-acetyltransferase [Thermocatellispora tengchongensis]MBB5135199.1 ribosomal protein S18 acetylase RimI-like enzyme [Thermocatellispora tengchongensis]